MVRREGSRGAGQRGRLWEASLVSLSAVSMEGEGGDVIGGVRAMGAIVSGEVIDLGL